MTARIAFFAAAAVLAAASAASADPVGEHLTKAAEDCIRAAAPSVVARSQGLSDAVTFLVDDLCAAEVRHAEAYERNQRVLAVMGPSLAKRPAPAAPAAAGTPAPPPPAAPPAPMVNPETGDIVAPDLKGNAALPLLIANWLGGSVGSGDAHARFRALAAQAVLAAPPPRR
jgi:hypothetical protein